MATEPRPRDLPGMVVAVLFIGLGAWVLLESAELSALGSVFPRTIAVVLMALSALLIVLNLRRPRATPPAEAPAAMGESTPRRIGLVVIMLGWALLLPVIGFFVSSVAAFVALLAVAEYERWSVRRILAYAAVALAVVAGFYFLMRDVLLIPLPRGLLF